MPVQLKAQEDAFVTLVSSVKRVTAIVIGEGSDEVEVFKTIARRLGLAEAFRDVAVTDAGGINTLRGDVLPAVLALIVGRVVSKPKPVALILDSDEVEPEERVRRLASVLEARGYRVGAPERVCESVWRLGVEWGEGRVPVLVAVSGLFNQPFNAFEKHELEDHIVYLKLLEGKLPWEALLRAKSARELVTQGDVEMLETASIEHLAESFKHLKCLAEALAGLLAQAP